MEALARLLTRERVLVELLVFKLVELRQLLLAGETRFLPWASEEVERATTCVREAELERAVLVTDLGRSRGLDEPSLTEIITDAPSPWRGMLEADQQALRASATEVAELLQVTRRLADAGAKSIAESLGTISSTGVSPYTAGAAASSRMQRVL